MDKLIQWGIQLLVNFTRLVEDEGIKSNGQQKMYCLDLLGVHIVFSSLSIYQSLF